MYGIFGESFCNSKVRTVCCIYDQGHIMAMAHICNTVYI